MLLIHVTLLSIDKFFNISAQFRLYRSYYTEKIVYLKPRSELMKEHTDLSNRDMLIYEMQKKSAGIAYALWFFLGGWGIHYFYLGNSTRGWRHIGLNVAGVIGLMLGWSAIVSWLFGVAYPSSDGDATGLGAGLFLLLLSYVLLWIMWLVDAFTLHETVNKHNASLLERITRTN